MKMEFEQLACEINKTRTKVDFPSEKDNDICTEDETPVNAEYSRLLKKFADYKKIPSQFEHLRWDSYDLNYIFCDCDVFHGLPSFLFSRFYSCHPVVEKKVNTPTLITKNELDMGLEEGNPSPLDLTGCPLECPFEISSFENNSPGFGNIQNGGSDTTTITPLLVSKPEYSRLLLNIYLHSIYKSLPSLLPVLFLCDGKDPKRTVFLAALKEYNTVTHIQATKLHGTYSEKSVPPLSLLKKELNNIVPGKPAVTEVQALAVYNFLVSKSASSNVLRLHCHWENPLAMLEPPSINAVCRLDAQILPGKEQGSLSFLYKELSVLKCIIEGLESGEIKWCIKEENDQESMTHELQQLIKVTKEVRPSQNQLKESVQVGDSNDLENYIKDILFRKRQLLEFTDNLWKTLIKTSSYVEVKEGLSFVTEAISSGEINPVILRNNKTSLGCWIKNHSRDQEVLTLDGMEPLKHLGEIGLHKLQEDYFSLFLGLELATREMLTPFFQSWENKEEAVKSLCLLHATLELVHLCKIYLHLPQSVLGSFTRQVFKQYKHQSDNEYKFSFQVPLIALQKKITDLHPDEWQVSMRSSSINLCARTSLHFAKTLLPHLWPVSTSGVIEDDEYHATKYICLAYTT